MRNILTGYLVAVALQCCVGLEYYKNYVMKHTPKGYKSNYERKLAYSYGREGDGFGRAVDIYDNVMLVGSCFSDESGSQAGSAHIFTLEHSRRGWKYESALWTNDTMDYDYFGWDVALHHNLAAVGAWQHDDGFENNGAVYFFEKIKYQGSSFWNATAKSVGMRNNAYFGISVALSSDGSLAYVGAAGAPGDSDNVGAVFVLSRWSNWDKVTRLTPADGSGYDYYGISVALDDVLGVVGAYGHNAGGGDVSGAAYVYSMESAGGDVSQWSLDAKLTASDASADDFFGRAVEVYQQVITVGADGADDSGSASGAAYIFHRYEGAWSQTQKLTPPEDNAYEFFGGSVAMNGDYLVIGADGDNHNDVRTGTVWVYERKFKWDDVGASLLGEWEVLIQLYASDRSGRDLYGSDVAVSGNRIVVGAETGDGYDYNSGALYVYTPVPSDYDLWYGDDTLSAGAIVLISLACAAFVAGLLFVEYKMKFLQRFIGSQHFLPVDFDESRRGAGVSSGTS